MALEIEAHISRIVDTASADIHASPDIAVIERPVDAVSGWGSDSIAKVMFGRTKLRTERRRGPLKY